jgi:hypothetical protein
MFATGLKRMKRAAAAGRRDAQHPVLDVAQHARRDHLPHIWSVSVSLAR